MGKIFGFSGGQIAPLPDDVQDQVESTTTLSGGQSLDDTTGPITNRYETTSD
ncbi:hypothetical protein [Streptomyces viridochromogenes]|uniref:hypothetical protein n=1 Tax=Streptomyces viridochromogenes TaxID=1938 RepID=UPI000AF549E7|nr:hypothetical protein [Streptomyces viridochromogenes]